MVVKTLRLNVQEGDIQELEDSLRGVNQQTEEIEHTTDRYSGKIRKSSLLVEQLDRHTGGLASSFLDVADGVKKANFSLTQTRAILISTGIGALVAGVALLVLYWEEIVDFVKFYNKEIERNLELLDIRQARIEFELELLTKRQEILEIQGKLTKEDLEIRKQKIAQLIAENKAELQLLKTVQDRLAARAADITFGERVRGFLKFGVAGVAGGSGEDIERLAEATSKVREAELLIADLEIRLAQTDSKIKEQREAAVTRGADQDQLILPTLGVTLSQAQELGQIELDFISLQAQARRSKEEAESDYRIWLAEQEAQAKIESYHLAADGFAAASQLIGQETAAGKAFAVASALVSTYLSANQAYQSQLTIPTPDAPIRAAAAAATAVLSGLANVKQILAVKIPGQGGGSSIGGSPSAPPAFNVVASSPQNQLNQALLEQNNTPIEAFVVEGGVTSAEELRRGKVTASSI